jgi:hypothetical protein
MLTQTDIIEQQTFYVHEQDGCRAQDDMLGTKQAFRMDG